MKERMKKLWGRRKKEEKSGIKAILLRAPYWTGYSEE